MKDHFTGALSGGNGASGEHHDSDPTAPRIGPTGRLRFVYRLYELFVRFLNLFGRLKKIVLFTIIIFTLSVVNSTLFGGAHLFGTINPFQYYFGIVITSNDGTHGNDNGAGGSSDRKEELPHTGSDPHHSSYQQVQSELAKMNSLIYAQQNNFFQLHLGSKELQSDLETQKATQLRFMGLYMRNTLNAAYFARQSIADTVDSAFAHEMVTRKMSLERQSGYSLVSLKRNAYHQLHSQQNKSMATLTVRNTTQSLTEFLDSFKEFQRNFEQQVSVAMATGEYLVTYSFQQARRNMAQLVARDNDFTGFEYEDVRNHLMQEQKKMDELFGEKINEVNQERYSQLLTQEYTTLNETYHNLVASALNKYALDITYAHRFLATMETLENHDLGNGKYVWSMNSSMLPTLPNGHGFYSEKFTAIVVDSQTKTQQQVYQAKLWLLRTSTEQDLWKVTYEQFSARSTGVRVQVTILKQSAELDLECAETYRQANATKGELVVDFDIPLTRSELERRGYILNGKIYVRAIVAVTGENGDDVIGENGDGV